jgi:hypothetical protein
MIGQFFVISLNCGPRKAPNAAIEKALSSYDWLRFSNDTYYVYAYFSKPSEIYDIVKPLLHNADLILVTQTLPETRMGWTSKIAIDWFEKIRT